MGAKQLAWIYFSQEKYEQSKEVLQKGIDIIEQNKKHTNNLLLIKTHASLLNGLNLYYQKIQNHDEALKVSKQAIIQLEKENIHVPSNYYSALITTYIEKHQIDSIYPYCQKMLTNSIKENNLLNQLTVYKNLIDYEKTKGNYKPLSEYQEKYMRIHCLCWSKKRAGVRNSGFVGCGGASGTLQTIVEEPALHTG